MYLYQDLDSRKVSDWLTSDGIYLLFYWVGWKGGKWNPMDRRQDSYSLEWTPIRTKIIDLYDVYIFKI